MTSRAPLAMDDFQTQALGTDQNERGGMEGLRFPLLGLFGEIGSLLSALKKKQRDREAYTGYRESVIEEFGDVLWYFSNIAGRANLKLSELARKLPSEGSDWSSGGTHAFVTFADLQSFHGSLDRPSGSVYEERLIELGGKVGRLLDDVALDRIERNRDALTGHLVEILRALVSARRAVARVALFRISRPSPIIAANLFLSPTTGSWYTNRLRMHQARLETESMPAAFCLSQDKPL